MLQIHFSNRYETLADLLLERLGRGDWFEADHVIVPSEGVRRDLTLRIADRCGICTQVQFAFLAQWLWRQIGRVLPAVATESPYAAPRLVWRLLRELADASWQPAHPRLAAYLASADAVMRFELARQLATQFEQLLTYRPEWTAAWRAGLAADVGSDDAGARADERWQAELWRRVEQRLDSPTQHPVQAFVDALQRLGPDAARQARLPASAHLFALPTMPPLYLRLLEPLARHVELHLYVVNPCRAYWFDVVDPKTLARLRSRGRVAHHETGHRLLATWGRQAKSQLGLLVDACGEAATDDERYVPSGRATRLGRLQDSILELAPLAPGALAASDDDRSLEVHRCHSLTRELEVLHDRLLGLFAAPDAPAPHEVLVVTPDLEAAAPLVDAVFGSAPPERAIPYAISGRARSGADALAQALLALLALPGSRYAASDVFALLQRPAVARRFGLDADELARIHRWLRDAGVHWALDAGQPARAGLPPSRRHSLDEGLDRLLLGHALPDGVDEPFEGRLPAGDAEGTPARALGALAAFVDALKRFDEAAGAALAPAAWQRLLELTLAELTQPADDELDAWRELRQALGELLQRIEAGAPDEPLPLAVLRLALQQALDEPARGGVPTGSVTFTSMSSLRHLPFRVVAAIGLADGAFPAATRHAEFDLLRHAPRPGDRQRRDDDRNLFLDLVVAARDVLHLSYTGRSVRDNAVLPPSVLVAELLDELLPALADTPGDAAALARARQRIVVEHPLQPFSPEAFGAAPDGRQRSHQREYADALNRALQPPAPVAAPADDDALDDEAAADDPAQPFFAAPLPAPGAEWRRVDLAQLVEFFRQPSRFLLRRRLGLHLVRPDDELQDDEPLLPGWPQRRALAERLLPRLLQGLPADAAAALAQAGTDHPDGTLGRHALRAELRALQRFAVPLRAALAEPCRPPHGVELEFDLDGERWTLSGRFADLRASGLLRHRFDELRPGDRTEAWLHHLLLCAAAPPGVAPRTRWCARGGALALAPVADARIRLHELLTLYRRGLVAPLPFFPKSSWSRVDKGDGAARRTWHGGNGRPGEADDPAHRLAWRGLPDPLGPDFVACADAVFAPLIDAAEGSR